MIFFHAVKQPAKATSKTKLTGSKSLAAPVESKGAISDEEYIEMDSVYPQEESQLHG